MIIKYKTVYFYIVNNSITRIKIAICEYCYHWYFIIVLFFNVGDKIRKKKCLNKNSKP